MRVTEAAIMPTRQDHDDRPTPSGRRAEGCVKPKKNEI
jgi:hypothetical protein